MVVVAATAVVGIVLAGSGMWLSPLARREIVRTLEEDFDSQVEIGSFSVSLLPLQASADKVVLRRKNRAGEPPLITLGHFDARTSWLKVLRLPHRVTSVRLQGLVIQVPPGDNDENKDQPQPRQTSQKKPPLVVGEVVADGTILRILTKDAAKAPLTFDVYKLTLTSVGEFSPMHYQAQLRNAKPPGLIASSGEFGPWNTADPGKTHLDGKYTFSNADLGVFKGVSGRLSSTGQFYGVLQRIEVDGQTDTPDFSVNVAGHKIHLATTFSATVDGENGNTLLHPVDARFGDTTVHCEGGVTRKPGEQGKTVALNAVVQDGRLADVLRLGVRSEPPPMTGNISFHARIEIPPGDRDITDKLRLDGQFDIRGGKFTKSDLERKVSKLCERSRGDTEGNGQGDVASNLKGTFRVRDGSVHLTGLSFHVPGATIRLNGSYGLRTETLDFQGTATTEAKMSQMTTGWKSFLLKALDPIFSKHKAGAVIPIHVGGTRKDPSFGLDLKP